MNLLINPVTDLITPFKFLSTASITLQERKFNNQEQNTGGMPSYKFFEAFPVEILPIEFSNETKNSTVNYTVLFAYKDYEFDKI